jgi:hypothetical protein
MDTFFDEDKPPLSVTINSTEYVPFLVATKSAFELVELEIVEPLGPLINFHAHFVIFPSGS